MIYFNLIYPSLTQVSLRCSIQSDCRCLVGSVINQTDGLFVTCRLMLVNHNVGPSISRKGVVGLDRTIFCKVLAGRFIRVGGWTFRRKLYLNVSIGLKNGTQSEKDVAKVASHAKPPRVSAPTVERQANEG
jgi:hypothetical protein